MAQSLSRHPLYSTWVNMKHRCTSPRNPCWHRYGGRGITVCDSWFNSFETFVNDVGPKPSPKHSLDRINNELGYCPENCRWATRTEQMNNKSRSVYVEYKGALVSVNTLAKQIGISYAALSKRIANRWPEDLWSTPPNSVLIDPTLIRKDPKPKPLMRLDWVRTCEETQTVPT